MGSRKKDKRKKKVEVEESEERLQANLYAHRAVYGYVCIFYNVPSLRPMFTFLNSGTQFSCQFRF